MGSCFYYYLKSWLYNPPPILLVVSCGKSCIRSGEVEENPPIKNASILLHINPIRFPKHPVLVNFKT